MLLYIFSYSYLKLWEFKELKTLLRIVEKSDITLNIVFNYFQVKTRPQGKDVPFCGRNVDYSALDEDIHRCKEPKVMCLLFFPRMWNQSMSEAPSLGSQRCIMPLPTMAPTMALIYTMNATESSIHKMCMYPIIATNFLLQFGDW